MRLLLDTHVFLWWITDAPELSAHARSAIANEKNVCYLSLASVWEMAIKSSLGKLALNQPLERFVSEQIASNRFTLLPIEFRHVTRVEKLPFHHRDPFDRLLLAQALEDKLRLVSADTALSAYGAPLLW